MSSSLVQALLFVASILAPAVVGAAAQPAPKNLARVDRYGQPLPPGVLAVLGTKHPGTNCLPESEEAVRAIAFSPDNRLLAVGENDNTVRLWDVATGRELRQLLLFRPDADGWYRIVGANHKTVTNALHNFNLPAAAIVFSPDGKRLAVCTMSNPTVSLWEVGTGKLLREFKAPKGSFAYSLAFSPDGKTLAVGGRDLGQAVIHLWDTDKGRHVRGIEPTLKEGTSIRALAFSSDGQAVAGPADENAIAIWDVKSGKELRRFTMQEGPRGADTVVSLAFAPDGKWLAEASWDLAHVWDLKDGRLVRKFDLRDVTGHQVQFLPDGETLGLAGRLQVSRADLKTGKTVQELKIAGSMTGWVLSPDGKMMASPQTPNDTRWEAQNSRVCVRDAAGKTLRHLGGHPLGVSALAISPDGNTVALGDNMSTITLWDRLTGNQTGQFHLNDVYGGFRGIAFSPNGKVLAALFSRNPKHGNQVTLHRWDLITGQELPSLVGQTQKPLEAQIDRRPLTLSFSRDSRLALVSGTPKGLDIVELWDLSTGKSLLPLQGQTKAFASAVLSFDGKMLISQEEQTHDATPPIRVWNLATGQVSRTLDVKEIILAISRDGKHLATTEHQWGGGFSRLKVRELAGGKEVGKGPAVPFGELAELKLPLYLGWQDKGMVEFSPDGKWLAITPPPHTVRDVATGSSFWAWASETQELYDKRSAAEAERGRLSRAFFTFGPDGTFLAAPHEGKVQIWDAGYLLNR